MMCTMNNQPTFLTIPLEIRLNIYELLLLAPTDVVIDTKCPMNITDYYDYQRKQLGGMAVPPNTLAFRTITSSDLAAAGTPNGRRTRSMYKIRDRFRARCMDATYTCVNVPFALDTGILGANRQIHMEAAPVLYNHYTFDFDSNIEACVSFLNDLTPYSQSCVRKLSVVKRALPYDKDFDRCEWSSMCSYIAANLSLTDLSLGIVSGMPSSGWTDIEPLPENAFEAIVQRYKRDEMQWARDLMMIKGLWKLNVRASVEHCPPPGSEAMRFFVEFSASVEEGFSTYLKKRMLEKNG